MGENSVPPGSYQSWILIALSDLYIGLLGKYNSYHTVAWDILWLVNSLVLGLHPWTLAVNLQAIVSLALCYLQLTGK